MKDRKRYPKWTWLACIGLAVMLSWFVWAVSVLSVDFNRRLRFVGDYDSVRVVLARHYTDSSQLQDSSWVIPPKDTFVTIDKAYDWDFFYIYYSEGDSACVGEEKKYTAGAATISTTDKKEIAGFVEDTLEVYHGAGAWTTGGAGSGTYTVDIYAFDTLGGETSAVEGAKVDFRLWSLVEPSHRTVATGASGAGRIATDVGSLAVRVEYNPFYVFPTAWDSITWTTDSSDSIYGYRFFVGASPDPDLCRVYGWVSLPVGGPEKKITVTFTVSGEAVHNSCDSTAFIAEPVTVKTSVHADSLGYFYADLTPSGCLLKKNGDSLQYKVTQELDDVEGKEKLIYVPQAESYEIVW